MTRPTPDGILAKINAGKLQVHPNRMPMTTQKIIHAMGNVERALLLPGGAGGGWDPRADSRLAALLAKPIIFKKPRQEPLAIADARSAIEDNQLAIEDTDPANEEKEPNSSDESSSDSSSSDSSSSENAMDVSSFEARLQQKDAQLSKAKEEFESIFSALCYCQTELEEAKDEIAAKDAQISFLQEQLARLQAQIDSEDDMMTED